MVLGRRFDRQATALTKQGRLAVYPSSRGQEACQVGAALRCGTRTGCSRPTATRWRVAPGARPRRGAHAAARRLALRLRPVPVPRRAAVHAAGDQHPARRRAGPRGPAQAARTRSRWRCSATARPARATPTRRSTSPPSGRRRWCSSCRTTATRSASRWPSRPPPRPWRTRASATASRLMLVDGNDAAAVYSAVRPGGGARAAAGRGPTLIEAHHLSDRGAHQRRRRCALPGRGRGRGAGCTATRSPGSRRYLTGRGCSTTQAVDAPRRRGRGRRRPALRDRMNRDAGRRSRRTVRPRLRRADWPCARRPSCLGDGGR